MDYYSKNSLQGPGVSISLQRPPAFKGLSPAPPSCSTIILAGSINVMCF